MLPVVIHPAAAYATKRGSDGLAPNIGHPGTSTQITADTTTADTVLEQRLTPITTASVAIVAAR
jgi:hypothetical protein